MAAGITWMLLVLCKEGRRLMRNERPDESWPALLRALKAGLVVELSAEEYAHLRKGYWGRINALQLICNFFSFCETDGSLVLVWHDPGKEPCFARMLTDNEKLLAAQTFGLRIGRMPPGPRFHRGICRLEDVWGDEWFALPDGSSGWVQLEQTEPLSDGVDVVLGFYDTFPSLPRETLVYVLDQVTERRMLERRWATHRPLVTLDSAAPASRTRRPQERGSVAVLSTSPLDSLLAGEELPLPLSLDGEEEIRERLFIRDRSVEIPRGLYQALIARSQRVFRNSVATCCQDEEGCAHLFWSRGARYFTRLLSGQEARELNEWTRASA